METSYVILRRRGGIRAHPSGMNPSEGSGVGVTSISLGHQWLGWSPSSATPQGASSEAAGRAACPGCASISWGQEEQLVALGQFLCCQPSLSRR